MNNRTAGVKIINSSDVNIGGNLISGFDDGIVVDGSSRINAQTNTITASEVEEVFVALKRQICELRLHQERHTELLLALEIARSANDAVEFSRQYTKFAKLAGASFDLIKKSAAAFKAVMDAYFASNG